MGARSSHQAPKCVGRGCGRCSRSTLAACVLVSAGAIAGCSGDATHSAEGSPVVSADSEEFRRAAAQADEKLQADKAAEARTMRRFREAPQAE